MSSPSSQPEQIDRDLAVMCIATAAEASLYEQRNEAVTNASTPNGPASASSKKAALEEHNRQHPPGVKRFEDLPPDWQRYARQKDRQKELSAMNADGPESGNPHPTQKECMEYQANVLFEQRLKNGGLPPMGGHVGPGSVSAPAVRGAGGTNSGVDRLA